MFLFYIENFFKLIMTQTMPIEKELLKAFTFLLISLQDVVYVVLILYDNISNIKKKIYKQK